MAWRSLNPRLLWQVCSLFCFLPFDIFYRKELKILVCSSCQNEFWFMIIKKILKVYFSIFSCCLLPSKFSDCPKNITLPDSGSQGVSGEGLQPRGSYTYGPVQSVHDYLLPSLDCSTYWTGWCLTVLRTSARIEFYIIFRGIVVLHNHTVS